LSWDGLVPAGTSIKISVKSAATQADFTIAQTFGPYQASPVDLKAAGVPDNPLLQVDVQLISTDKSSTPTLKSLSASFTCEGQIN
jgi:hypothetical protein